jgi:iron complex outermembrane receptor protein/outer membrane receptor for ferric coprogen and ferric-rhodotorulic acid
LDEGGHTDTNLLYGIISADLTKNTLLNFGYSQQKEHAVPVNSLPRYSDGSDIGLDRDNCGCDYRDFWDKKNSQAFIDLTHQFENGWMLKGSYLRAALIWIWLYQFCLCFIGLN